MSIFLIKMENSKNQTRNPRQLLKVLAVVHLVMVKVNQMLAQIQRNLNQYQMSYS
jgi:hypothetical protein